MWPKRSFWKFDIKSRSVPPPPPTSLTVNGLLLTLSRSFGSSDSLASAPGSENCQNEGNYKHFENLNLLTSNGLNFNWHDLRINGWNTFSIIFTSFRTSPVVSCYAWPKRRFREDVKRPSPQHMHSGKRRQQAISTTWVKNYACRLTQVELNLWHEIITAV